MVLISLLLEIEIGVMKQLQTTCIFVNYYALHESLTFILAQWKTCWFFERLETAFFRVSNGGCMRTTLSVDQRQKYCLTGLTSSCATFLCDDTSTCKTRAEGNSRSNLYSVMHAPYS